MKITIPGIPIAKGRPRIGKHGSYTPTKTVNYENLVQYAYIEQSNKKIFDGPLGLNIDLYFPIPKSYSKKKIKEIEEGKLKYVKRPDVDNCVKSITDALNNLAYKDDSQIVMIVATKNYTEEEPRAEVTIKEI